VPPADCERSLGQPDFLRNISRPLLQRRGFSLLRGLGTPRTVSNEASMGRPGMVSQATLGGQGGAAWGLCDNPTA
jgi:hypothetical protein